MDIIKNEKLKAGLGGSAIAVLAMALIQFIQQAGVFTSPEQVNLTVKKSAKETREYIDTKFTNMRTEFVPRSELTIQLNSINDRMTTMQEINKSGFLEIKARLDYLARRDYYNGKPIPVD